MHTVTPGLSGKIKLYRVTWGTANQGVIQKFMNIAQHLSYVEKP